MEVNMVPLALSRTNVFWRMEMYHSERRIGDDEDSLTEMNETAQVESFSYNDVRFQRNVSYIVEVLTKELT
jgi:hypothetical protein